MYSLTLSNGSQWWLDAGDEIARPIVDEVAAAMGLLRERSDAQVTCEHLVQVFWDEPSAEPIGISCVLPRSRQPNDVPFLYYFHTALTLAQGIQREGGLLLHAALAEFPTNGTSQGVIFSAPGGTGKSTTSRRLPPPWHAWSDDACLIIPLANGQYQAHPWPTWSRYLYPQQTERKWDVSKAIPLSTCVFLKQAPQDRIEALGTGQAASLLTESARQINYWDHLVPADEKVAFRLRRFDALCALAQATSAYLLEISLDGNFWLEVEKVL